MGPHPKRVCGRILEYNTMAIWVVSFLNFAYINMNEGGVANEFLMHLWSPMENNWVQNENSYLGMDCQGGVCANWEHFLNNSGEFRWRTGRNPFLPCCVSCCVVPLKSCDPWWPRLLCSFLLLLSCRWPCKGCVCIYNWSDKAFYTSILFPICCWKKEKKIASSSKVLHLAAKRESIFMQHYSKKGNIEVHYVEYLQAK